MGDPGQACGGLCDPSVIVAVQSPCLTLWPPRESGARRLPTRLRCGRTDSTGRAKLQGRAGDPGWLFTSSHSARSAREPGGAALARGRPGAYFLHVLSQAFQTATEVEK